MKSRYAIYYMLLATLVSACQPVIVERNFPNVPPDLQKPCNRLNELKQDTTKLSEVLQNVTSNYSIYHECKIKVDAWNEWYTEQKRIFNEVN